MASFERARESLTQVPQLSPAVEHTLQKCGEHAHLVLETVLATLRPQEQAKRFINAQTNEQKLTNDLTLLARPLLISLQKDRAECGHCSPFGRLWIQSVSQSGSSMEGLMGLPRQDGYATASVGSDTDIMLQFGPVRWAESGADGEKARGKETAEDAVDAAVDDAREPTDPSMPSLIAVPTENPGFVLLLQEKEEGCKHEDKHCFTAESVRQLVYDYSSLTVSASDELTPTGPATSFHTDRKNTVERDGFDLVPCLRASWWPSEEFFERSRTCDWPPAAAREDIKRFGIHLVPVGATGSLTEREEWRLSFSRAEVVAAWYLNQVQLSSLTACKACKAALGLQGKTIKSYFLKTTLFWLCQETLAKEWKSVEQGITMMMDFLEKAIDDRYLPCFFWKGINLLWKSTKDELDAMRRAVRLIRCHATRLLAHELPSAFEGPLGVALLFHPAERLSEDQLKACIAADLVADAAQVGVVRFMMNSFPHDDDMIKLLLRSSAREELAHYWRQRSSSLTQGALCRALLLAPDDVGSRCRLTSCGEDCFSLDAAPLVDLLSARHLQWLLGDPTAVSAWLERQRRQPPERRPVGLPADLNSPRALADLVLNPALLTRALRESVPAKWGAMVRQTQQAVSFRLKHQKEQFVPLPEGDKLELELSKREQYFATALHHHLKMERKTALDRAANLGSDIRRFFADPSTEAEWNRIRTRLPDSWCLRQFVFNSSG